MASGIKSIWRRRDAWWRSLSVGYAKGTDIIDKYFRSIYGDITIDQKNRLWWWGCSLGRWQWKTGGRAERRRSHHKLWYWEALPCREDRAWGIFLGGETITSDDRKIVASRIRQRAKPVLASCDPVVLPDAPATINLVLICILHRHMLQDKENCNGNLPLWHKPGYRFRWL